MANNSPLEYDECVVLATYLEILKTQGKILAYTHIPQETFTKNWGTKIKNKRMGVKPGIPDYLVITKTQILFMEMKRKTGGTVSPDQKIWLELLKGKKTVTAVAKGFDEAKLVIEKIA